jgi:hypothetical protein
LGANVSIWNFSDIFVVTPSSDNPGTGAFGLNSVAFSSTTILTINRTDNLSRNVSGWLANWGASTNAVEGHLNFVSRNAITAFANFNVTAVSGYTNHIAVWVTHLASGGTHNYFDDYEVGFVRAGDVGTSGFSGYSGSGGASEAVVSAAAKIYAYRGFR